MDYQTLKTIHLYSVITSLSFYLVRVTWMLMQSPWLHKRWVKILPHVIDTILLISAIALCVRLSIYPGQSSWLTAKVVLLIVYIVSGGLALKYAKKRLTRLVSLFVSLISASWIVATAVTKSPWGLLHIFFNM